MEEIQNLAKKMAQQIKHYIITTYGKTYEEATDAEIYRALSLVIREEIMINWTATNHTIRDKKARRVYYLSLEWLPGRLTMNNLRNISDVDIVKHILQHLKRNFDHVMCAEPEPGLGNGGLGRLAACYLDSLATHHYPSMGYGIRYQYGIFEQEIWSGVQIERPDTWLLGDYPWEMRRDSVACNVNFGGKVVEKENSVGEKIHFLTDSEEVRALAYDIPIVGYGTKEAYSAMTLRLWTTKESPRNFELARFNAGDLYDATRNTAVTDVLYPNDKYSLGLTMRIKQEYLLVASSLQDIFSHFHQISDNIDDFANLVRVQINDTHPALVVADLMRIFTAEKHLPWDKAWEITRTCCSYTNHTVLKESLEEWDKHLLHELLPRQMHIIEKINDKFLSGVRAKYPHDEERVRRMSIIENARVRMANLAIVGSHKVNGVAKLHSDILKNRIFPEMNEYFPDVFTNVTNGVTQRRWLLSVNPDLSNFFKELIGDQWITNFQEIEKIHDFADKKEVQEKFLEIKLKNKKRLVDVLVQQKKEHYGDTIKLEEELFLDADALFDVQIKRIHEYKRQLMNALQKIMIYHRIRKNPDNVKIRRKVIIAGKAAPGYDMAKHIIRLFYCLGRKINTDPVIGQKLKIIFIENYNVSRASLIIPAADLSEQISTAGMEASGTGNMKLSMNGALTIGTEDGANIEMREAVTDQWWPFRFGATADELVNLKKNHAYDPKNIVQNNADIQEALESLVSGEFAENDVEKEVFKHIHDQLLHVANPDQFFVLQDLFSYNDVQNRVEEYYSDQHKWAAFALHNIAGMGNFSSDRSVKNYAEYIWDLKPCPIDKKELDRVRKEFLESDRCYIA